METIPFAEGNPRISLPSRFILASEVDHSARSDTWYDTDTREVISFTAAIVRCNRTAILENLKH